MKNIYHEISRCRACGNTDLVSILHLGEQALTGVFPKTKDRPVPVGPLELVKCNDNGSKKFCGLVQLRHSYEPTAMYGEGYGYRSSLNASMVRHLTGKVKKIVAMNVIQKGDLIIDIGSNDGTLLKCYPSDGIQLTGIDPSAEAFRPYYPPNINLIVDFFSSKAIKNVYGSKKAKVITSIAMFYDLEDPVGFMRQVCEVLDDQGIWVMEQSYMPTMLKQVAYDTICHEHLEYYGLKQIIWMANQVGLKVIDVELNDINGGSFSVTLSKNRMPSQVQKDFIQELLKQEDVFSSPAAFGEFKKRVFAHKDELQRAVKRIHEAGQTVVGYGASTKGNVILQYCGFTPKDIACIAEVNPDKFGSFTPGTLIPIVSEADAKAMNPDFMMVLPWHFRDNIISREREYLRSGGALFFPLPSPEIVRR